MTMTSEQNNGVHQVGKRKLKVLVITMGGTRQEQIQTMFENHLQDHFELPVFSPGVPAREIRNRYKFLYWANEAGLLPIEEWKAIHYANATGNYDGPMSNKFFDCLVNVPVTPGQGRGRRQRRGSQDDVKLHYSVELWRKGRALNRGRAVLACSWAHLIAMRKLTEESFDLILEDNVRTLSDGPQLSKRMWDTLDATTKWENTSNEKCHLLYYGWLGSVTNLQWICQTHAPNRKYISTGFDTSIFPFPRQEHLDEDLARMKGGEEVIEEEEEEDDNQNDPKQSKDKERKFEKEDDKNNQYQHSQPGGNPIWGMFAYWISPDGYQELMECLQNDVGAMLWKGKRARTYSVKPIDKIIPRQLMTLLGPSSVQLSTHPSFFRAPMLSSKIHTQWDPEFCKSTTYQLEATGLDWAELCLQKAEQDVVRHYSKTGNWLTGTELRQWNGETNL
jgi:hypothetical protein